MTVRARPLHVYLFASLGLLLGLQLVVGGLIFRAGREVAGEAAHRSGRAAAEAAARNVELRLGFALQLIAAGAKRPGLIRFLEQHHTTGSQQVVDVIYRETPYFDGVYALSIDLAPEAGSPTVAPRELVQEHAAALREVLAGAPELVSAPVRSSRGDGRLVVVVAAGVQDEGRAVGVLLSEVAIDKVAADVLSLRYGDAGYALLFDEDGRVLADRRGTPGERTALSPLLRAANAGESARLAAFKDPQGRAMVAAFAPMALPQLAQPWLVAVVQPEAQAFAQLFALTTWNSALLASGLLLVLVAGLLLAHSVTGPLDRLVNVARDIGAGRLRARAGPVAIVELDVLGRGFNAMADRLVGLLHEVREQNRELEERVRLRTLELARARDDAEAASRAKGAFLANMSHEIRTPMNGVLGTCELLLESDLGLVQREYAETMHVSAVSLLGIIDEILDLSKIEAGMLRLEEIEYDVELVADEAVRLVASRAQQKGIEVTCDTAPELPTSLLGDPLRVRQILTNLLGNAVKFTSAGEVALRLRRVTEGDSERLRLEVADTGIGIAEEARERLFQSFTQLDASTTRRFGGTGLGLAICAHLVGQMGGEIGVDSVIGEGSTFWVTLPLRPSTAASPSASAPSVLLGHSGWVVSAHATTRHLAARVLTTAGMRVDSIMLHSTLAPLATVSSTASSPEVVVVDVPFGTADVPLLISRVRDRAGSVPVVLLAPMASAAIWDAAKLPAVSLVSKPMRRRDLLERVSQALVPAPLALPSVPGTQMSALASARPQILVAEDDEVSRRVVLAALAHFGFDADAVRDGVSVVASATARPYAAVLMDCHMPELDGCEATRIIRQHAGPRRHVPIIGLSAAALADRREQALAAGMNDYVTKPLSLGRLREALVRAMADERPVDDEPVACELDPQALANLRQMAVDGDALVVATASKLLAMLPERVAVLGAAIVGGDAASVEQLAHAFKSTTAYLGAQRVSDLCASLEAVGAAGDLSTAATLHDDLQRELECLSRALAELIAARGRLPERHRAKDGS
ncbi:MAG: ATP-binding protein [Myxococcota bacterium]